MKILNTKKGLLLLGIIAGIIMVILASAGNPKNMALCTACFIRDSAGAMKFHTAAKTQYFRPEILGMILGSMGLALAHKEYKVTCSKNVLIQFLLGNILMFGALVFLGCTLRLVLRMASGDLSSYIGLIGLVIGVGTGTFFIKKGYSLGSKGEGYPAKGFLLPMLLSGVFILTITSPNLFAWSTEGPGSMYANRWLSLIAGLIFGLIAYQTRLCFTGSIRDVFLAKDYTRLVPIAGIFTIMLVYNISVGNFAFQAAGPIAHNQTFWNIISMFVVGFAGVLAGGCPVRQIIMSGTGSSDASICVLGMFSGAAISHNFGIASTPTSPDAVGGPGNNGQILMFISTILLFFIAFYGVKQANNNKAK